VLVVKLRDIYKQRSFKIGVGRRLASPDRFTNVACGFSMLALIFAGHGI